MYAISTTGAHKAIGSASQGTSAARFVFVSGQLPIDAQTQELSQGSIAEQANLCISNVKAVLGNLDLTFGDVTKTTLYLTDLGMLSEIDAVWVTRFPKPWPARSVVEVKALPQGASMMLEAIACR